MATIALEGMEFKAHHGVYDHERELGGRFIIDIYLESDIRTAEMTDDLSDTIDYAEVYGIVARIMEKPVNLLERVASRIMMELFSRFRTLVNVRVRVSKMEPPLEGKCTRTYVEESRSRQEIAIELS